MRLRLDFEFHISKTFAFGVRRGGDVEFCDASRSQIQSITLPSQSHSRNCDILTSEHPATSRDALRNVRVARFMEMNMGDVCHFHREIHSSYAYATGQRGRKDDIMYYRD